MRETLDIAEETARYEDEWLLFEVVETDELDRPVRGRLLCHSRNHQEIYEEAAKHPGLDLQFAFAGDPFPSDAVVIL